MDTETKERGRGGRSWYFLLCCFLSFLPVRDSLSIWGICTSYKSNLQNAVDAAALAGASGYTAGGDTVDYHPEADEMAAEYLKANLTAVSI